MSDREWPTYDPGGSSPWGQQPSVAPGTPIMPVPYRHPQGPPPPPPGNGGRVLKLIIGVLIVSVLGIVGIVAVVILSNGDRSSDSGVDRTSDADDRLPDVPTPVTADLPTETEPDLDIPPPASEGPTVQVPDAPPVLSAEGFDLFVDAVDGRGAGTQVFSAVVYPEYAVVDVPLDQKSAAEQGLRWDGEEFDDFGPPDNAITERVDLALVDSEFLVTLVGRAERLLEEKATTTYVIIEGASTVFSDDGTRIRAYASNLSETAYIATRLDGTLVRRYVG